MKLILLFLFISYGNVAFANPDIPEVRNLYHKAATSKKSWTQLSKLLSPVDNKSSALLVCYKGAADMMEAKYVINPWSKLNSFRAGKKLIEEAVKRDSKNMEIRFLRYSVQTNLPSFLDYNDDIDADKSFLIKNLYKMEDKTLKNSIIQYLSVTKACTEEEINRLRDE
ncbi:MAG: hypothetical protein EOP48_23905 [Sphingobacteriales bacterium]|nr:MAG: hypothetical protein EOP48_23905 [Sphingobacteriales bacterium]